MQFEGHFMSLASVGAVVWPNFLVFLLFDLFFGAPSGLFPLSKGCIYLLVFYLYLCRCPYSLDSWVPSA